MLNIFNKKSRDIVKNLLEDYEGIFHLSLESGLMKVYHFKDETLTERIRNKSIKFSKFLNDYILPNVEENYKDIIFERTKSWFIIESLKHNDEMTLGFFTNEAERRYLEIHIKKMTNTKETKDVVVFVTDNSEVMKRELLYKEKIHREVSIIEHMTDSVECIIYSDFKTMKCSVIKSDDKFGKFMKTMEMDLNKYDLMLDKYISIVEKGEYKKFIENFDAKRIQASINFHGMFVSDVKFNFGEGTTTYRVKTIPDTDNKFGYIISFECIDKEIIVKQKSRNIDEMISAIASEYLILAYLNFDCENGEEINIVRNVFEVNNSKDINECSYDDVVEYFAKNFVHKLDRENYLQCSKKENISKALYMGEQVSYRFRYVNNEMISWVEFKAISDNFIDNKVAIISYKNIDDEIERDRLREKAKENKLQLQHLNVINELTVDYDLVLYYSKEEIDNGLPGTVYKMSELLSEKIAGISEKITYTRFVNRLLDLVGYEPDVEQIKSRVSIDSLYNELRKNECYFVNIRISLYDEIKYYQLKYITDKDEDNNPKGFIMGLHSVDSEIKERIKFEQELKQANERAEKTIVRRTADLRAKNLELSRVNDAVVELMGDIVEMRDNDSGQHIRRVKAFTSVLTEQVKNDYPEFGLDEAKVDLITSASALHDVGKIMIPDNILLKNGKLTKEEFEVMKEHTQHGYNIIKRVPSNLGEEYLTKAANICKYHHERFDGKGYPEGLKGEAIPLEAQIVGIADCFDALTSKRVYKEKYDAEKAYNMIINGECGVFSKKMINSLINCKSKLVSASMVPEGVLKKNSMSKYSNGNLSDTRILLVDDNPLTLEINKDILENEGSTVVCTNNGEEAISIFYVDQDFDAIILDFVLENEDVTYITSQLRMIREKHNISIPIIALTTDPSFENTEKAAMAGADAHMPNPVIVVDLTAILLSHIKEKSEYIEKELEVTKEVANTDALTKIKNITAYTDEVLNLTEEMRVNPKFAFAAIVCDLNDLKQVNDTNGHNIGDEYIIKSVELMRRVLDDSTIFRIGGDEFVIILQGADYNNRDKKLSEIMSIARDKESMEMFGVGNSLFSVGMATYDPVNDYSINEVIIRADKEMYMDKRKQKSEDNINR